MQGSETESLTNWFRFRYQHLAPSVGNDTKSQPFVSNHAHLAPSGALVLKPQFYIYPLNPLPDFKNMMDGVLTY